MPLGDDVEGHWGVKVSLCPNGDCRKNTCFLFSADYIAWNDHLVNYYASGEHENDVLIRPKAPNRTPISPQVNPDVAQDYLEACLVLADSPKASAALSRRCLQSILREKGGVKKGDLANEIQQVLDGGKLPSYIEESIDAVRNIGNFAAHPGKSVSTGGIVTVEPGEAEWNLEVIEMLFDFYYVQPAAVKARRDALNAKLADVGKPPMK
jgi:Domain of unknown function (DUF4145)